MEDLDFADDLALISHNHQQMQEKTELLNTVSTQLGLKKNGGTEEDRKQELYSSCWETFEEQNKSKLTQNWEYSIRMSRQFYSMDRIHGQVHWRH